MLKSPRYQRIEDVVCKACGSAVRGMVHPVERHDSLPTGWTEPSPERCTNPSCANQYPEHPNWHRPKAS